MTGIAMPGYATAKPHGRVSLWWGVNSPLMPKVFIAAHYAGIWVRAMYQLLGCADCPWVTAKSGQRIGAGIVSMTAWVRESGVISAPRLSGSVMAGPRGRHIIDDAMTPI